MQYELQKSISITMAISIAKINFKNNKKIKL
jgi:hypothetical protein